jgi:hypothetical protein
MQPWIELQIYEKGGESMDLGDPLIDGHSSLQDREIEETRVW